MSAWWIACFLLLCLAFGGCARAPDRYNAAADVNPTQRLGYAPAYPTFDPDWERANHWQFAR